MIPKKQEDTRLPQYLNKLLDEMPVSDPGPMLTERIMHAIQTAESSEVQDNPQVHRRKDWFNSFVAITATVLFIQSGLINKIMNFDSGIIQVTTYIQHLSQFL